MLIYSSIRWYNNHTIFSHPSYNLMEGENSAILELSQSFPDELIVEILTRLPVKSLMKFRCVSKSWRSQISSPAFIKAHLKYAININNSMYFHNHHLLCVACYPRNHFREFSLNYLLHGTEVQGLPTLDYNIANPELPMRILGSLNGIVCVAIDEDHLFLWNPILSKSKRLPPLHTRSGLCCYLKDGFGYEESNDDYKVVAIYFCIVDNGPYEVQIYSLKTAEWKRIEDFTFGIPLDQSAKYARGKLHWLVNSNDGSLDIITLDLATESYGKIGTPPNAVGGGSCANWGNDDLCLTLGVFSENLCLLFDDHETRMDLWMMKEYGNKESWARAFSLPNLGSPGFYPHMLRLWLFNDEILLLYGGVIIIYNQTQRYFRFTPINDDSEIYQGEIFVESLISPSDGDPEEYDGELPEGEGNQGNE